MSKENQENVEPFGAEVKKPDAEKPVDREKVSLSVYLNSFENSLAVTKLQPVGRV